MRTLLFLSIILTSVISSSDQVEKQDSPLIAEVSEVSLQDVSADRVFREMFIFPTASIHKSVKFQELS